MESRAGAVNSPVLTRTPGPVVDPRKKYQQTAELEEARRQDMRWQEKVDAARHTEQTWMERIQEQRHQVQCQQQIRRSVQSMHSGMKQIDQRIGTLSQLAGEYEALLSRTGITINTAYFDASRRYGSIRQALLRLNQQYDHLDLESRNLPLCEVPSVAIESYPSLDSVASVNTVAADGNTKALLNPHAELPLSLATPLQPHGELPIPEDHSHAIPTDPSSIELRKNNVLADSLFINLRQDLQRLKAVARKKEKLDDLPHHLADDIRVALGFIRHFDGTFKPGDDWENTNPNSTPA